MMAMTDDERRSGLIFALQCAVKKAREVIPYTGIVNMTCEFITDILIPILQGPEYKSPAELLDEAIKQMTAVPLTKDAVAGQSEGTVIWMEQHTDERDYLSAMVCSGNGNIGNFGVGIHLEDLIATNIRFWSSRPTDEQRKAVKWNLD